MATIQEYMRNRMHSDAEFNALIQQIEDTTVRAERLESLLEYVAMMTDIELPDKEGDNVDV